MKRDKVLDGEFEDLRRRAESLVHRLASDEDVSDLSAEDIKNVVHELQVHQTELELQNEELRRAQLELEDSRDKYADLYDYAPVGYFTLDNNGLILEANLSGAHLVGYDRAVLIRKPFAAMCTQGDYRLFYLHLRAAFEEGLRQTCELKLQRHDQSVIHVRMEIVAMPGRAGKVNTCRAALSDITEVRRVEEEVLKVQERVLGNMVEGVCVCDETGFISFANSALETLLGYRPGDLLGKNLDSIEACVDTRDPKVPQIIENSLTAGQWRGECGCLKEDGTILQIYLRVNAIDLFEDRRLIVIWEDVTGLRRAEKELRDSERRFRAIFESTTDLIFIKDSSLKYSHVNPAFEKLVGRPAEDLVGLDYVALFGEEGSEYEKDVDTRVLSGQVVEEERSRKVHGTARRFQEVRVPLRDQEGKVIGLSGISRDVTERRERELPPPRFLRKSRSKVMEKTLALAQRAATRNVTVLLTGESGSGKDYLARSIHDLSDRSGGPYFTINCAAVAPELAESELFGHERGSFTGAHARKRGLLELAEGGTLLLNEIGELRLPLQAKLLTFLDTRKIMRVGGEREISVNARLIAATNKDLAKEVEAKRFREDLYYRLSVMVIEVPPLRFRKEDIPDLVADIAGQLASELHLSPVPRIDPATMNKFSTYNWPGNIRELRNVIERTLILGEAPPTGGSPPVSVGEDEDYLFTVRFNSGKTLRDIVDEISRSVCLEALRRSHGNKKEAARLLGIARDSLYRHLKHLGIEPENMSE